MDEHAIAMAVAVVSAAVSLAGAYVSWKQTALTKTAVERDVAKPHVRCAAVYLTPVPSHRPPQTWALAIEFVNTGRRPVVVKAVQWREAYEEKDRGFSLEADPGPWRLEEAASHTVRAPLEAFPWHKITAFFVLDTTGREWHVSPDDLREVRDAALKLVQAGSHPSDGIATR